MVRWLAPTTSAMADVDQASPSAHLAALRGPRGSAWTQRASSSTSAGVKGSQKTVWLASSSRRQVFSGAGVPAASKNRYVARLSSMVSLPATTTNSGRSASTVAAQAAAQA